jgi:hypothetical protein
MEILCRNKGFGGRIGHDPANPGRNLGKYQYFGNSLFGPQNIFPSKRTKSLNSFGIFLGWIRECSRRELPEAVRGHTCPQPTEPHKPLFMVVAISLQLIHFPVALMAKQTAKNCFFCRQQVAKSLTLISFFYSQSGEQGNPKQ